MLTRQAASLVGCQAAVLAPSTLHLFWDLLSILTGPQTGILVASQAYPTLRWGVERAAARGTVVQQFAPNDTRKLQRQAAGLSRLGLKPLIATDGVWTERGQPAPLAACLDIARSFEGYLVIDDTQAFGLLGHSPDRRMPYGHGGGGSLQWHDIFDPRVIVGNSFAKGFGVSLAVLAGEHSIIRRFREKSQMRVHTSPPNAAEIGAGLRALAVNRLCGEQLRCRLLSRVLRFRQRLSQIGLSTTGDLLPIQTLKPRHELDAARLHAQMLRQGLHTLLLQTSAGEQPRLGFVLTAQHSTTEIDTAMRILQEALHE